MRKVIPRKLAAIAGFALGLAAIPSQAAVTTLDFNTDPVAANLYTEPGGQSAEWIPNGGKTGANGDGYLVVTRAAGGQGGLLVFQDLEAGLVVKAFKFECDLRIGGGTERPADGFSLNYASADDPATTAGGQFNGTDGEPAPSALAEEGTQTGLAIGFDTWQSDPIRGVQDVVGISVRVDGALIAQFPCPVRQGNIFLPTMPNPGAQGNQYEYNEVPFRNLDVADANYAMSLQTGARNNTDDLNLDGVVDGADPGTPQPTSDDPNYNLWMKRLVWERFSAELTDQGKVIIFWKGKEITPPGGLATTFTPRAGRIILAGRTGGAWEVHHVDNMTLTTIPASTLIISQARGTPTGFEVDITDSGPAVFDASAAGAIQMTFDGNAVTASSTSKTGATTTIIFSDPANPLTAGSKHALQITVKDTRGVPESGTREVTIPSYITLPAAFAVTGVDTTKPGFKVRVHQVEYIQNANPATLDNTIARAEQQLHGDWGANIADTSTFDAAGYFHETDVLNYSQLNGAGTLENAGNFNVNNGFEDQLIPGVEFVNDPNNIAAEILTYLHFPEPGAYTIIFNSDDGFRTTAFSEQREQLNSLIVSQDDRGRGATDTPQLLYVPTAGYYPFRTVWFEGGGGANMEWVAITPKGGKALINDASNANSLKAYRERTGAAGAAVTFTSPVRGSGTYWGNARLAIDITDGAAAVDQGSIKVEHNGVAITPAITKAGAVTKLTYTPSPLWPAGSSNNVAVSFTAGGQNYTGSYSFNVVGYQTIPASMALPLAQVDKTKPGFLVRTVQAALDLDNSNYRAETQIAGLISPNVADLSGHTGPGGYYQEADVINYTQSGNSGNFQNDYLVPGIPGTDITLPDGGMNNFVQEILTVIDFPAAGIYAMTVASDDGFITSAGNPKDAMRLQLGTFDGGRGIGGGTTFTFNIPQAGLYPMRTLWYEGGGGAGVEWMTRAVSYNGVPGLAGPRILINDSADAAALKAYQYPLTSAGSPYVKHFAPSRSGRGNRAGVDAAITAVIVDGATVVDPASVKLWLAGVEVTPTVTKSGTETSVSFKPAAPLTPATAYAVILAFGDRELRWTFQTGQNSQPAFFIEAEDFNHSGGQHVAAASDPLYRGGAYGLLGAAVGVDYQRGVENASPLYRIDEQPNQPMDRTGDRDRGMAEIVANFKLGWTGGGTPPWFNYTRNFPAGKYNILAGLSHGDPAGTPSKLRGTLEKVTSDPTQGNQTVELLGRFNAPSSGGWGNNNLVTMKDEGGNDAVLTLGGVSTMRFTAVDGDFDFLLFVPAAAEQPVITKISRSGGNLTVEWTGGGTLWVTDKIVGGTWTNTTLTSPAVIPESQIANIQFGQIRR